jgi:hypothetical protein
MSSSRSEIERIIERLKTERDELKLKLHLGQADAKDEWLELERKWQSIESKLPGVKAEVGTAADNVWAAVELAAEEIKKGYDRIRHRF